MLFAKPTRKGTGIEFWGDYNDLVSLYYTFLKLSSGTQFDEGSHVRNEHLLIIIRSDIYYAFHGSRLINNKIDNGGQQYTTYYGFHTDWITVLYTISALRYNAGYVVIDEEDLCNLNKFEYWTRKALRLYDDKGAKYIELFINKRIDITTKYVYAIYLHICCKYLGMKPNKTRFRNIPTLLILKDDEFFKIKTNAEIEANMAGCGINDYDVDYTGIEW